MSFSANPIFPGDIHDSAVRLGNDLAKTASANEADPLAISEQAWVTAAALGWPALMVPEDAAGMGGSLHDLAAVAEGCGRAALSLPLGALCFSTPLLLNLAASTSTQAVSLRSSLTEAAANIAFAPVSNAATGSALLSVAHDGQRYVLNGEVAAVEVAGTPSDYLLVFTSGEAPFQQSAILALPADMPGLVAHKYSRLDGRSLVDLQLNNVTLDNEALLLQGNVVAEAMVSIESAGIMLAAAEVVGAMGQIIESTIDYLSTRKQFGAELSTFQALRHDVADMYVAYENLRALVQSAYKQVDDCLPPQRLVSLLKLALGRSGRFLAESTIQLHGGMGMTEELLAARLAKRLLMAEFEHGGTARHLELAAAHTFNTEVHA